MKRLFIFILLMAALSACHSHKSSVVKEHYIADSSFVETQSEEVIQSSFDWSTLGLTFDSLIVVNEYAVTVADSVTPTIRSPSAAVTKTTMKVFGGSLNHEKASGETLSAECEKSVEATATEDYNLDTKESRETKAATLINLPWLPLGGAILLVFVILFRKKIFAVVKRRT